MVANSYTVHFIVLGLVGWLSDNRKSNDSSCTANQVHNASYHIAPRYSGIGCMCGKRMKIYHFQLLGISMFLVDIRAINVGIFSH